MPRHTPVSPVIDIPSRSGVRGRIDKLAQEYLHRAQALRIAAEILDEDDRKTAQELGPKRFLQAMNLRAQQNGHALDAEPTMEKKPTRSYKKTTLVRQSNAERRATIREYLAKHPGATTNEIAAGLGWRPDMALKFAKQVGKSLHKKKGKGLQHSWTLRGSAGKIKLAAPKAKQATKAVPQPKKKKPQPSSAWYEKPKIQGPAMTLFLLEHLAEAKPHTATEIMEHLAAAGSPIKSLRMLNAPLGGTCAKFGYIKTAKEGGYLLTAKGAAHMKQLREQLEAAGTITSQAYFAA